MIRTLDARVLGADAVTAALERSPEHVAPEIQRAVDEILAAVRARGDAAVIEYTNRFDGTSAKSLAELTIAPQAAQAGAKADALRSAGRSVEHLELKDTGHRDWEPEVLQRVLERSVTFLGKAFA